MKREDFFSFIMNEIDDDQIFEMTYKKKNNELRNAQCKIRDHPTDETLKGTGMSRKEKMDKYKLFQYFDVFRNAYRSAPLNGIIDITVNGKLIKIED